MIDFGALYGAGAAMGFSARETGRMSLWEMEACVAGWLRAQGGDDEPPEMGEDDYVALLAAAHG